jgi:hypothetical protein
MSRLRLNQRSVWSVATDAAGKTGNLAFSTRTRPYVADYAPSSAHIILVGNAVGTPRILASNDHDPSDASDLWNGEWDDIEDALDTVLTPPSGAGAKYLVDLSGVIALAYYFDFAWTSGTGSSRAKWGRAK